MIVNMIKDLNSENIEDFIQQDGIVYISATWCGPCKVLAPIVNQVANDVNIPIGKLVADDTDGNGEWVASLGIRSVPTLLFYQYGNIIHKITGIKTQQELTDLIKEKYAI